jgi:hypothetical protein
VTQQHGGWYLSVGASKHSRQVGAAVICSRIFKVHATVASSTGRNVTTGKLA